MYLLTTRKFRQLYTDTEVDLYVENKDSTEFWITSQNIGEILGYFNKPENAVMKLHKMFNRQLLNSFKEVEVNARRKGICKTIVYNFGGLLELCYLSGRKNAARAVNFLWEVKQDFMTKQNLPVFKSELQPFNYDGNYQVRAIEKDSEFWFVAKDVCEVLELSNITEALRGLDDDELTSEILKSGGQGREMRLISESGLYALIMKSNKPEAKRFSRWVRKEVLPALARTGTYTITKQLTGKATDTQFYSADEIAAELGTNEYGILSIVHDNDLDIYGFFNTDDCLWYFTEEGREKILEAHKEEIQ